MIKSVDELQMINKMQPVLEWIISEIERINSEREEGGTISEDETNQELVDIFHRAANKFTDIDFELVDDEDALTNVFGSAGCQSIREAEQGRY